MNTQGRLPWWFSVSATSPTEGTGSIPGQGTKTLKGTEMCINKQIKSFRKKNRYSGLHGSLKEYCAYHHGFVSSGVTVKGLGLGECAETHALDFTPGWNLTPPPSKLTLLGDLHSVSPFLKNALQPHPLSQKYPPTRPKDPISPS